jgi:hypothetical protein
MFHQLFPHKGVPYIVWIKDGKLLNTTDGEQVTEKTIQEVLEEKFFPSDGSTNEQERPLMLSENLIMRKICL